MCLQIWLRAENVINHHLFVQLLLAVIVDFHVFLWYLCSQFFIGFRKLGVQNNINLNCRYSSLAVISHSVVLFHRFVLYWLTSRFSVFVWYLLSLVLIGPVNSKESFTLILPRKSLTWSGRSSEFWVSSATKPWPFWSVNLFKDI